MLYYGYDDIDYVALLKDHAKTLGTKIDSENILHFPNEYADGYYKAIQLPHGLQAMLMNVTLNQDFYINRLKSDKEFFVLRFDEIKVKKGITMRMGKESFSGGEGTRASAFITGSGTDFGYILRKGTSLSAVNILITKACLEKCLGIDTAGNLLQKYLSLRSTEINFDPVDIEYRKLLNEIMI